jgi:hypothetical protein
VVFSLDGSVMVWCNEKSELGQIGLMVDPLGSQATQSLVLLARTGVGPHVFVWPHIVGFNARSNASMLLRGMWQLRGISWRQRGPWVNRLTDYLGAVIDAIAVLVEQGSVHEVARCCCSTKTTVTGSATQ